MHTRPAKPNLVTIARPKVLNYSSSHVGEIDGLQTDHLRIDHLRIDHPQIDRLDANLLLWNDEQDLYSAAPSQETCAWPCKVYGSHAATWARSYRSYRSGIHLPWQIYSGSWTARESIICPTCKRLVKSLHAGDPEISQNDKPEDDDHWAGKKNKTRFSILSSLKNVG